MIDSILTIALIHFLGVISPGPDVILILRNSLTYGYKTAQLTALGIAIGVLIHVSYCILGFALIISQSQLLFVVVKILGATYLIYIGLRSILSQNLKTPELRSKQSNLSKSNALGQGFICNLLNPKATLFFLGLFTLVISPDTPYLLQSLYGIEMFVITFVWFAFLSRILHTPKIKTAFIRYQAIFGRIFGLVLVGFAIRLLFIVA